MISALLRLAALLALVRWAEQTYTAPSLWLADLLAALLELMGGGSGFTLLLAMFIALLAARTLSAPLWFAPVPMNARLGPVRHPFSERPLRVHLRVRASRFFIVTLFEMWLLSALWTVTSSLVDMPDAPQSLLRLATAAGFGDWRDGVIALAVVHVLAATALWFAQAAVERALGVSAHALGFVRYHLLRKPVRRFTRYQVLAVHFASCAALSLAVEHRFAVLIAVASLLSLAVIAMLAGALTLLWARRRDRWLDALRTAGASARPHDAQLLARTIGFLHPEQAQHPAALGLALPSPQAPPEAVAAREELPQRDDTLAATPPETDDGADLELDLDLDLAEDLRAGADEAEAAAEGGLPWRAMAAASGIVLLLASLFVAWEWLQLPNTAETRQLARSAHVHVRKSGDGDAAKLSLTGNRFDFSLNTSLENVSEHFRNAVVASEDHRFYEHGPGYMTAKFLQAGALCAARKLNVFARSANCAGNSTITQQLARNLLLSESRSVVRKLTELLWAIKMELGLSKQEILEFYVNRLYLGQGNYGVELGARDYFGKRAAELDVFESALLAAAIKRPRWNVRQDIDAARERAALIVALMDRHGYVKAGTRLPRRYTPVRGRRSPSRPYLGHLWQWIRPAALDVLRDMDDGDYKIVTSLNAEVQIYAQRHLTTQVRALLRSRIPATQGAVVVMRPDGRVLAMVGGVGEGVSARGFNRARRPRGMVPRPPASSFKPFIYLAALEAGIGPDDLIDARPVSIDVPGERRPYQPRNHDGRDHGFMPLREGLVNSVNTAAVRLLHDRLGFEALFGVLDRLGVDPSDFRRQWGIALGSQGVPLVEMVGAYATIANGGSKVTPNGFTEITTASGKVVWRAPPASRRRVFEPDHIAQLTSMLRDVVSRGTGVRARASLPEGVQVAGKTGTGDSFVDGWFIGYTDDLVIGVWIGNDRPVTMPGLYGGTAPARTFNRILRDIVNLTDVSTP